MGLPQDLSRCLELTERARWGHIYHFLRLNSRKHFSKFWDDVQIPSKSLLMWSILSLWTSIITWILFTDDSFSLKVSSSESLPSELLTHQFRNTDMHCLTDCISLIGCLLASVTVVSLVSTELWVTFGYDILINPYIDMSLSIYSYISPDMSLCGWCFVLHAYDTYAVGILPNCMHALP